VLELTFHRPTPDLVVNPSVSSESFALGHGQRDLEFLRSQLLGERRAPLHGVAGRS
jgi:hypothetical protein